MRGTVSPRGVTGGEEDFFVGGMMWTTPVTLGDGFPACLSRRTTPPLPRIDLPNHCAAPSVVAPGTEPKIG
jgi:hypothetical protein